MARKKTKIVCTMGPATESDEVLRELILAGMNVARFNFSHGSHEYHRTMIGRVRSISEELGIPIAIMLDTKGPEVRTGLLEDGKKVTLTTGESVIVTTDDNVIGNTQRFSLDYKNLPKEVQKGSIILIDDGLIGLEVDHVEGSDMFLTLTLDFLPSPSRTAQTSCLVVSLALMQLLLPSFVMALQLRRSATSAVKWALLTYRSSLRLSLLLA